MKSKTLQTISKTIGATLLLGSVGQVGAVGVSSGDVDASIYGFARLNMSYDLDDNRAVSTQAGSFSPSANPDAEGHFGADAVQSRLGFKATHSSGLKTVIEGDFRPGTFRLRHAYGEYNGVLAGQTWSNFNSFVGWTPTLDFDSLAGNAGSFNRNAQVRYTTGPLSIALEQPSASVVGGTAKTGTPALTARLENSAGAFSYSIAGLLNQVSSDDGSTDDSAMAYGVFGAAKFSITDMVSLQGALIYTDGANSYLWRSGSNYYGASAYLNGNSLETIAGYGGQIGLSVGLGGGKSVKVGYGTTSLDLDDAVADGALTAGDAETNQNIFLNYTWTPVESVMMGVEYGFFDQESQGGDSTDANRVLFAAQYNF